MWIRVWSGGVRVEEGITMRYQEGYSMWVEDVSRFWASGKAGKLGSNPLRLSFLFNSCGLWTVSSDFVTYN